jgi:hypothetical protein
MFSTFCLDAKGGGKPKWCRLFCRLRTASPNFFLYHTFAYNYIAGVFTKSTFSNTHNSERKSNLPKALYPAWLF